MLWQHLDQSTDIQISAQTVGRLLDEPQAQSGQNCYHVRPAHRHTAGHGAAIAFRVIDRAREPFQRRIGFAELLRSARR